MDRHETLTRACRLTSGGCPPRRVRVIPVSAVCLAALLSVSSTAHGQPARSPEDAILNVLVWGVHMPIRADAYSGRLRIAVDAYLRRARAYRSTRSVPAAADLGMLYTASVSYEQRLAAISGDSAARRMAREYVDRLRPCYEWEGGADCPEREAVFADEYQQANPQGPFSAFLPLLSAHRWLCTAEAYETAQQPDQAARSLTRYEERIAVARESSVLLIRTAADQLFRRRSCH
jgi:hypothetical protein